MRKVILLLFLLSSSVSIALAQTRQVTGKVVDNTGEPLIGVSITIKGTTRGSTSDINGNYKVSVPTTGNSILVFKYIGYKTEEVAIGKQSQISVTLKSDATALNEVVVIGYGTVKKKDLTGAVASVNAETIAAAPVSSAMEAIAGRMPGVQVTSTEGSPEATMSVRVRGGTSITQNNDPLYIVDGFPVGTIADIAPQDIESIDVLKDASSTAIYGSRGANGVVLITTKSGKEGKTSISFNAFTGTRHLANKLDVLTPYDYAKWQYELAMLRGTPEDYTQYFGNYQDIDLYADVPANDWQEIIFGRTGTTYNQNLSISGGTDKTKFSISHNFVKDKAIMLLSGYERQNLNFKLNQKLYDKLSLDLAARYSDTKIKGGGANEQNEVSSADSRLKNAMIYPPIPVSGLTNTTETNPDFALYNPIISISDNDQYVHRKVYNFNGAVNYEPIEGMRLRSEVGYDGYRNDQDRFYGATTYYVRNVPAGDYQGLPGIIFTNSVRNSFRNTNTLNYNFKKYLNKDHDLTVLLGHEFIKTIGSSLTSTVHGFPVWMSFDQARKLSTQGKSPYSVDNNLAPDEKLLSFFGRANYNYKGKYLFAAALRADGSSKFAEGNRWGYFPSVSAAWRISDEDFFADTKSWLSDLKLRASYGAAGNNNIPSGQIVQSYNNSSTSWVNGFNSYWAPSKVMANPDLTWETTTTGNFGVDFSLFNSRLNGTIDRYFNNTKDLLLEFPVPGTGYDYQYRNIGETRNKGWELSASWAAVRKDNFDLTVNGNISFNKNEVVSLGELTSYLGNSGWASTNITKDYDVIPGFSLGRMYGYVSDGRYEVSDFEENDGSSSNWTLKPGVVNAENVVGTIRPGSMKLKDIAGDDGMITNEDRRIIGNTNPKHTGGFSLTSRIFSFDLGAYFNWSYGNDVYNANKIEYTSSSQFNGRNMLSIMESGKRWTNLREDGTISNNSAELAEMNANTTMWSPYMKGFFLSDWAVEDGSFLRLSTLTLGYTLPTSVAAKLKMKNLRIYASGYNLWLLTNYSGFDPEVSTRRRTNLTPGVDYSAYPRSRSYVFGLNVNF